MVVRVREGRINERKKKSGKYANDWQGEEDEALAVTVSRGRMRSSILFFFLFLFLRSPFVKSRFI